MKNDYIFQEYTCLRCKSQGLKQIPETWNDKQVTEYYPNWYFCTNCSYHQFIIDKEDNLA